MMLLWAEMDAAGNLRQTYMKTAIFAKPMLKTLAIQLISPTLYFFAIALSSQTRGLTTGCSRLI